MVVQHNIPAINSHRNMGINNAGISKNLEKLSSGFRINRAADDAAGLAISEKMRGQIRGLNMAEQNTKNGVSLIQTAEGALSETHSILQRMRELAVQSSNGTYQDEDRIQITKEFEALKSEVDRIAESTHYNNIKLLDGSLGGNGEVPKIALYKADGGSVAVPAITAATVGEYAATETIFTDAPNGLEVGDKITVSFVDKDGAQRDISVNIVGTSATAGTTYDKDKGGIVAKDDGTVDAAALTDWLKNHTNFHETFTEDSAIAIDGSITATAKEAGTGHSILSGIKVTKALDGTVYGGAATVTSPPTNDRVTVSLNSGANTVDTFTIDGKSFQIAKDPSEVKDGHIGIFVTTDAKTDEASVIAQLKELGYNVSAGDDDGDGDIVFEANKGQGVVFQIGANGGQDQRVKLAINDMSSKAIGITDTKVGFSKLTGASLASASVDTITNANTAINIIEGASTMVSTQRAELGALQNRLESTLNSLGVAKENLTSAESVIRDVDMAKEMMEFTKNNILVQASQAMLAQANSLPQGVLQLLR